MNHSHNIVVNGRELIAHVTSAAHGVGAPAALISISEQENEVARLKLVAPVHKCLIKGWVIPDDKFLQECWVQTEKRKLIQLALESLKKPFIAELE